MGLQRVGHVVIKMRDLEKAKEFYQGILGMKISVDRPGFGVFFRFGDYHHDIAVFQTSPDAELPRDDQVGLVHVAIVADSVDTVKAMYERCKEKGVPIVSTTNHGMTKSLYIKDPEGNEIEIYAEVPEYNWRDNGFRADPLDLATVTA
jgi:catechol-2,3-dioxygenase